MLETGVRGRHGEEDEEVAYRLQVIGAREGAIRWTLIAGAAMLFANHRYPLVARHTLAGKAFVVSWFSIFGMVINADHYLLEWEQQHRIASEKWRELARKELAAKGTIPTETAMRAWKVDHDTRLAAAVPSLPSASSPSAPSLSPSPHSKVLDEIKVLREEKEAATLAA
ncbi:hypothetical protein JCM6882_003338 [Rhodosporidiobolus microsporus]